MLPEIGDRRYFFPVLIARGAILPAAYYSDMPILTRRWNDPPGPDEGRRILITRYRPRGVSKQDETWDLWMPNLGPSAELHVRYYGKHDLPIGWPIYRQRYLREMQDQKDAIEQ